MSKYFLFVACFFLAVPALYAENSPCQDHQCIAIVDAGSTGSRLHVYTYDLNTDNTPININELYTKKVKPGIATIEPNAATLDTYLGALFAGSPSESIPVYFYATAGMRLLPPAKQKAYYDGIKYWFDKNSLYQLKQARTISGNEEALFDWLSVNYNLGTLQSISDKSVGVMDMGGASVQIAFPLQKPIDKNDSSQMEIEVYGRKIGLSVHSFLGLGQTEMSHQFLNSESCFSYNYPMPNGGYGQGNALKCEQRVSSLMNAVHNVQAEIPKLLNENPVDEWYSMGGLSNLAGSNFFQFPNNQLTNQSLLEQADSKICGQPWDIVNAQDPNDDYIYGYCLFSAYYYALMVDGYGFYPEQIINYIPPEQNIDWTTGVVLSVKAK